MERVARSPRCSLWLIELDGRVVGSGGLESFEDAAVLIAACVHGEARRQGLQTAFIRFRLEQAAAMGLGVATVATTRGGAHGAKRPARGVLGRIPTDPA